MVAIKFKGAKAKQLVSPFRLSSLIRGQKDPNVALQLFQNPNPDAIAKKPFRYSHSSYDLIISYLGRAKMFEEMDEILLQLKRDTRIIPEEIIFCNVMSYYGRARLPDRAQQVFDEMPSFRCERSVKSVNSLLSALLKCREYDKMREVFQGMEKYGRPDTCSYNILIHCFFERDCVGDAWKVFGEMLKKGLRPNVVTFGTLIHGVSLKMRIDEAFRMKEVMVRVYDVLPGARVYASLIKAVCCAGELSEAFQLKEEMVQNGIKLEAPIYASIIDGLFKAFRKNDAFELLNEMNSSGIKPNTVVFNILIASHCRNKDFAAAYKILEEMAAKGCKPDVISYNLILGRLCLDMKQNEAIDLFEDMPRRGCKPDVVSHRILFDGLCDGKMLKEAALILDEMLFHGFKPHPSRLNKFINVCGEEGNTELLSSVLNSVRTRSDIDVDSLEKAFDLVFDAAKLPPGKSRLLDDALMTP